MERLLMEKGERWLDGGGETLSTGGVGKEYEQ